MHNSSPEFIGSVVIAIIAVAGHTLIPHDLATIIIASVMPIVPGVLITMPFKIYLRPYAHVYH